MKKYNKLANKIRNLKDDCSICTNKLGNINNVVYLKCGHAIHIK